MTAAIPALVPHTFPVYAIVKSIAVAAAVCSLTAAGATDSASGWQAAAERAVRTSPDARILVIDLASGRRLASHHLAEASRTLAAPGSTLKPLALYGLIAAGRWNPDRRVACDRKLDVGGHSLACTHPPSPPFDAREALTWSCNSYFAEVARSLRPVDLGNLLRPTGLLSVTGLAGPTASSEAAAEFREPTDTDSNQLTLLGIQGIRVTPLEMAVAYRWLALSCSASKHASGASGAGGHSGLRQLGMARQAGLDGVPIAGKTGTAEGASSSQSHGWFAGIAPAAKPQVIVVVYLPAGRGADAAAVASMLLSHSPLVRP